MATQIIVSDWKRKLYKDLMSSALGMSELDDGYKSGIRLFFLFAAFLAKFIKQYKTPEEVLQEKFNEITASQRAALQ